MHIQDFMLLKPEEMSTAALNGACHNLREKAAEVQVIHKAWHWLITQQRINTEPDNLEGVERDADGDNEVTQGIPLLPRNAVADEIRVLVVQQGQQEHRYRTPKQCAPTPLPQTQPPTCTPPKR